ncbi:riboflavin biosynthesis protein RibD [Legionella quinlivanii]|uniref:Riboflavin biosynthesis protein RibD n=1 Tax=Legionella quinlivanii TaxID=45073 RepID=A0A364LLU3_9GAMM|nr:bifunctional diaminohydroxyphosphoribosylaminopyrimidine deaminase/5-amino-6-(5-phosphoribosylamino)uracil reductase RibD [Legionella quinlivanii]RAP37832.1 riboflavin biosynthesis protein RibD [Legionella quinlivanii]
MDENYLLAALEQAFLGRGTCAPNPSVGAVAVREGNIIARAFHKGAGTPHAEVLVFEQFPKHLEGVTLYVTLEPCNHWGRTPPCVNAIIAQGVDRVVYGYRDPNPVVISNNTPSILKEHGIESRYLPLKEIDDFYISYRHWRLTKKPFVSTALKQNFSGESNSRFINPSQDEFFQMQRKNADIILTVAEGRYPNIQMSNININGNKYQKNIAIIDDNLQLDNSSEIFNSSKKVLIYFDEGKEPVSQNKSATYYTKKSKDYESSLDEIITHLGELGFHDVWVEGSAELLAAIHQADLVDRTYIYLDENQKKISDEELLKNSLNHQKKAVLTWQIMNEESILCCDWRKR